MAVTKKGLTIIEHLTIDLPEPEPEPWFAEWYDEVFEVGCAPPVIWTVPPCGECECPSCR